MKQIKQELATKISEILEIEVVSKDIEIPDRQQADFAYPAMKAASVLGDNPRSIAENLAEEIEDLNIVESVEVAGPGYVNFHLDKKKYSKKVAETLGSDRLGVEEREGRVLVEFSCPNLAKPMHIGHLRNNCLGDSIQRIMRFVGYDVTSENYIGDWGTKHGQVIYAFNLWGSMEEFEEDPMGHMYELYVKLHDEADEEIKQKARDWSRKIEEGDEEAVKLWNMFRKATIEYNKPVYEDMNVHFDRWTGESVVAEEGKKIVDEGLEKGIFKRDDDGSVFVDFKDESMPNTIVQRDDGATLYLTRDIANIIKRENEGFDLNLYIVANEQDLHFKQLFELTEDFGVNEMESEHVSYGMLHLKSGSMSSSKGNIIKMTDLLKEAKKRAEEVEQRDVGNAKEVGYGAVKYANLNVSKKKDIEFSWDRALSFEGDSGPYLQYSNTRAKSILRKADTESRITGEFKEKEYTLVKKLAEFPEKVENAANQREPAKIANYLSDLCEEFNSFYHSSPVLDADKADRKRRLKIVQLFVDVSDQGLQLLGIEPLEEM